MMRIVSKSAKKKIVGKGVNTVYYTPTNEVGGGGYTGFTLSVSESRNLVQGITSKVLKLITSNFIHRYVTLWRSAVYKNLNSFLIFFRVIALCKF